MTSTKSVKIAFPKGHTNFSIYSGKLSLSDYECFFIHNTDKVGRYIRVTLYRTMADGQAAQGKAIRKLYTTSPPQSNGVVRQYRTLTAPTRATLGFERSKEFSFRGVEVPAIVLKTTDTSLTFDVDLTSKNITDLLKAAVADKTKPETPKAAVAASKSATEKPSTPTKSVAVSQVRSTVTKVSQLSLPGSLTLSDLTRMGFKVMATDADDNPFHIEAK